MGMDIGPQHPVAALIRMLDHLVDQSASLLPPPQAEQGQRLDAVSLPLQRVKSEYGAVLVLANSIY